MGQVHKLDAFSRCCATDLGNLAAGLGQLHQHGIRVRPTWAVSTCLFEQVLTQALVTTGGQLALLTRSSPLQLLEPLQLQGLARHLQAQMLTIPFPEAASAELAIAIQQSGVREWRLQPSLAQVESLDALPGLWPTLVVNSERDSLEAAIQQLWANSFTAQNLLIWLSQDYPLRDLKLAIVVQALGVVQRSGFLYVDGQGLQVEAVWGDSCVIAQGDVLPSRQTWTWEGEILSHQAGYQPLLWACPSWLSAFDPSPEPLAADLPSDSTSQRGILQCYGLNPVLHPSSALSPDLLSRLEQLGQQIWAEHQKPFQLEWVYAPTHDLEVVGYQNWRGVSSPSQSWQMLPTSPNGECQRAAALVREPDPPIPLDFRPDAEAELLLIGVPASPGQVQGLAWVMQPYEPWPEQLAADTILVTPILNPTELPILQQVVGIITEQGGLTSHGAILARELGIPAVVAIATATKSIRTGDPICLDGSLGNVKILKKSRDLSIYQHPSRLSSDSTAVVAQPSPLPVAMPPTIVARDTRTQLWVNLSQLSSLSKIQNQPIAGIGLLRAEFMALDLLEQAHPLHWLQEGRGEILQARLSQRIRQFLEAVQPRPVFYRFLDLHRREYQALKGYPELALQAGADLRGTLSYQYFPTIFQLELAALQQVQQAGYENLNILLPFVRSVSEVQFCQNQIQQAGLLESGSLQLWMMAEVPSVLFQLADYQQAGIQGISIGTNDLTRLLLGIDRDQPPTQGLDARHPAVKRAIAALIRQSRELGLPCTICGDAPAHYPELVGALVEWGITGISVSVAALESTHQAIQRAEQRLFFS